MNKIQKPKQAFTIIEVVLVLAVAGLIFLVVFAAIPRLQASRRDNQRKRDAEQIVSLVVEFQSNTGAAPDYTVLRPAFAGTTTAFSGYASNADFQDPSGSNYFGATWAQFTDANENPGEFYYYDTGFSCNAAGTAYQSGQPADSFVFLMRLERGIYCVDNGY